MRLSAPIYVLKRQAKELARREDIALHAALDRIAAGQGFRGWSLLAANHAAASPAARLYHSVKDGDLLLIGARPGRGKTRLALDVATQALGAGGSAMFFTMDLSMREAAVLAASVGIPADPKFSIDCSDNICADYIIEKTNTLLPGDAVVVDYLQLMDQKRSHAPLAEQIAALKGYAQRQHLAIVLISQIDRSYDPGKKAVPDISDVRLPNPVDVALFSKSYFIGDQPLRA